MHVTGAALSLIKRKILPVDGSAGDFVVIGTETLDSITLSEAKSTLGVSTLEDKYVKCLWFEVINSGTSGTLTPPTNSTLLMDQWAAGVDALASTLNSGIPTLTAPETSGSIDVTATLDVSGNWTLSGTPAAYPVAIIYCYKVKLKDLDDTKTIGGIEVVIAGEGGGSSAVTSVNGLTGDVVITIPVTSVNGLTGDVSLTIPEAGTDYLTPETLALTYEPVLPDTPEDPETKFLNGNRQWAVINTGSIHAANTDTYLDYGGTNQVAASDVKSAVTNSHAPGSDNQDLSGLMVKSSNLSDVTDVETARLNLGLVIGLNVQAYDPNIAFRTDKLSAFAITTSAEFAGVISDPTGTGYVVLSDSPTFTTKISTPAIWASDANGLLLADDSGSGIFIEDGGYVGIGTSNPSVPFEINSTITAMAKLVHTTTSGLGGGSGIYLTVNDGAAVASGDRLGYLFGGGTYDASNNFAYSAGFSFYTTENWEATKRGTKIVIEGTNTGATGRGTWMTILDGKLGIGIATPAQGVDVSGSVQVTTSLISPKIKAYDGNGLTLVDDSDTEGIWIADGGKVCFGTPHSTTYGLVNVRQQSDTSTGGFVLLNSGGSRSMRFWVDASNICHIDSGTDGLSDFSWNTSATEGAGGCIGISKADPAYKLDIATIGTLAFRVRSVAASGPSSGGGMAVQSDDGAAISLGDRLGFYYFGGFNGTTNFNQGAISAFATEDWSTVRGTEIRIEGTSTGDNTRTPWVYFKDAKVGINAATPLSALDVNTGTITLRETDTVYHQVVPDSTNGLHFKLNAGLANVDRSFMWSISDSGGTMTEFMRLTQTGYLGIGGVTSVSYPLDVISSVTAAMQIKSTAASGSGSGCGIRFVNDDGAALANGDRLGYMYFGGSYGSNARAVTAGLASYTTENWSVSGYGCDLRLLATRKVQTSPELVLRLKEGNMSLGDSATEIGTSGEHVFLIESGVAPTTSPGDAAQLWTADRYGQAGYARLYTRTEDNLSSPVATLQEIKDVVSGRSKGNKITHTSGSYTSIRCNDSDTLDIGLHHDFTIVWEGHLFSGTALTMFYKHDGTTGIIFRVTATGFMEVVINADTFTCDTALDLSTASTRSLGAAVRRSDSERDGGIWFYADGIMYGSTSVNMGSNYASAANTAILYIDSTDGPVRTRATISNITLYNYYLTSTYMRQHYLYGVDAYDMWGTTTSIYESDFSAGVDSFTGTRATVTGNVDGIAGYDDVLSCYASSDASTTHSFSRTVTGAIYKRIWLEFYYYIPATNTNVNGIKVNGGEQFSTVGAWTRVTSVVLSSSATLLFYLTKNDGTSFTGAGSASDDLVYIKSVKTMQVGALLSLVPEGIQWPALQWLDETSNKNHAVITTTQQGASNKSRYFELRWTCTWSGTHEAQYIGGLNTNILPVYCKITEIIGIVSGTTINDIIIGDGSDTDHWVALTTGLSAGIYSFTIANSFSDGTNRKMVVDPDANFTGSIAFTIKGFEVEI